MMSEKAEEFTKMIQGYEDTILKLKEEKTNLEIFLSMMMNNLTKNRKGIRLSCQRPNCDHINAGCFAVNLDVMKPGDRHMTLGELMKTFIKLNTGFPTPVRLTGGNIPGEFTSYRGYYDQIALTKDGTDKVRIGEFLRWIEGAIGSTYTGYKGGEYRMTEDTKVWVANYGNSDGAGITGVEVHPDHILLRVEIVDPMYYD